MSHFRYVANLALRASNLIAIAMLFICDYQWGKHADNRPIRMGFLLAGLGAAMVLIALPLGGCGHVHYF